MYIPVFWIILAIILLFQSLKILREDERMVVFRLGRFLKVVGPGWAWLIPFIDKGAKVNLNRDIPGWQVLSKAELDERLKALVMDKFHS
ncbi:MAG TPA: SPFH domain-containing protein [Thermodesulfobacteriota bacterium]|nr:SPFH domain-containing protein [Thermodesulfobacteriota bacterium]